MLSVYTDTGRTEENNTKRSLAQTIWKLAAVCVMLPYV